MTTVKVQSGACGFVVLIRADKGADGKIVLALETNCDMVKKMLEDISILDKRACLLKQDQNPVHKSAAKHLKHAACPVPSGILKALEVESGMNVARDVSIVFVNEP